MLMNLFFVTCLALTHQSGQVNAPDYGEVYFRESSDREVPRLTFGAAYAGGISNSFLVLHSLQANAQVRLWKFISTGVMAHMIRADFSDAGDQVSRLNQNGFVVRIPTPRWGVFSHSQFDLILGKWNLFNWIPLQIDLLVGGGFGWIQKRDDYFGASQGELSYLWSIEQRSEIYDRIGLSLGAFGHRGGIFLQAGLFTSFF